MHGRLAAFWFLYLAGLGIFFPLYSLYLRQEIGLSGSQVGLVMAALPLVGIFAQPLWGQLADRTGSRRKALAAVAAGTALGYLGLGLLSGFVPVLLGTAGLAIFATSVLPMATALTLAAERAPGTRSFGFMRMWGSLGFLAMAVSFPALLGWLQSSRLASHLPWRGLGWLFPPAVLCSLLAALLVLRLPPAPAFSLRSRPGDVRLLLRHPPVLRLLLFVFAAHCCLQGPIGIFPLYVASRGGGVETLSGMWIVMLLLEIPLIGYSAHTLRRLGPRGLLTMGLAAEAARWLTCALTTDLTLVRAVQVLHGVGVAGIIIGAPLYLERAVPGRLRSTGQALVATAGFGFGAIVSNTAAGWLFEHAGAEAPYLLAGGGLLLLGLLVRVALPEPYRPPWDDDGEPDAAVDGGERLR